MSDQSFFPGREWVFATFPFLLYHFSLYLASLAFLILAIPSPLSFYTLYSFLLFLSLFHSILLPSHLSFFRSGISSAQWIPGQQELRAAICTLDVGNRSGRRCDSIVPLFQSPAIDAVHPGSSQELIRGDFLMPETTHYGGKPREKYWPTLCFEITTEQFILHQCCLQPCLAAPWCIFVN